MASYNHILVIFTIFAITLPAVTMAKEYWVGGPSGWNKDVDYKGWASDKHFYVGDTLVFNYTEGSHNVFKVNATAFAGCEVPPSGKFSSGHDVITLATPGKKWYICGMPGHCSEHNQKLVIDVNPALVLPWLMAPAPAPTTSGSTKSGYSAFMAAAVMMPFTVLLV